MCVDTQPWRSMHQLALTASCRYTCTLNGHACTWEGTSLLPGSTTQDISSECMAALGGDHNLLGADQGDTIWLEPALVRACGWTVTEDITEGDLGYLLRCNDHRADFLVLEQVYISYKLYLKSQCDQFM
jgi:hypothetical protein